MVRSAPGGRFDLFRKEEVAGRQRGKRESAEKENPRKLLCMLGEREEIPMDIREMRGAAVQSTQPPRQHVILEAQEGRIPAFLRGRNATFGSRLRSN